MATPAQGSPPQAPPDAGGVSPADQQANPLQTTLAKLAQLCQTLADQNPVVSDDVLQARSAFIQALQKTMMSAAPSPDQNPTPPQG